MACFYVWGCSCMHIHVEARDQPRVSVIKSHHFVYWNKVFQGTQGLSLAEADSPINPRNLLFCLSSVMSTSTYCHTFPRILGVKHSSSCMYSKHFVCHLPNPRFLKCYSLYQTWSHHFVCFKTVSHDHWCFELMMLWTLNLQESFWLLILPLLKHDSSLMCEFDGFWLIGLFEMGPYLRLALNILCSPDNLEILEPLPPLTVLYFFHHWLSVNLLMICLVLFE